MLKQIDYQGKLEEIAEKFQGRKTEVSKEVNKTVQQIVEDIQKSGDTALFNYAKKFDGYDVNISNLLVTPMERETGLEQIDEDYFRILRRTKSQIEEFHKHQLENSWNIFKEMVLSWDKLRVLWNVLLSMFPEERLHIPQQSL